MALYGDTCGDVTNLPACLPAWGLVEGKGQ